MPQLGSEYQLAQTISTMQGQLQNLATTPTLLNASTGQDGGLGLTTDTNGLHCYNTAGNQVNTIQTSDGTFITYDNNGQAQCRFGALLSSPGNWGGEIWTGSAWIQLVAGVSVSWTSIAGKPSTYPPSAHTHAGSDITSNVNWANNANSATAANTANDAAGSSHAYNYNVGGTSYYAVWIGSDYLFGKNTSSARYKGNIQEHRANPADVLKLTPVTYDRLNNGTTEYGLIAEQVAEHCPELVQWFEGRVDNVRYDLLSVALLDVVKHQNERLDALEAAIEGHTPPKPRHHKRHRGCNNPPPQAPEPHPYTITPQD